MDVQSETQTPGKAASDVADAEDVTRFYNLFLRRNPENEIVISENIGRKIADVFLAFLESPEFNNKVLCPLMSEEVLWTPYRGSTSFLDLRRWATTTLPVEPDFCEKLAASASWESLYLALLLDARTQDLNPRLNEPSVRHVLEMRRLDVESNAKPRDLVGRVDHVDFGEVRGWCADEADLEHHLIVEIFADGVLIGTAPCDEYQREIQDVLGGKGTFGFTFRLSASHRDLFETDRSITVREQATRRILGRVNAMRPAALPPPDEWVTEAQAKSLFRRKASGLLPLFGRRPIDFSFAGKPEVSVIMVARDRFALTLMSLGSLRASYSGRIELILADSGSTDEVLRIEQYVLGAILLRFSENIGFLRACNAALCSATADAVLFLNNDVELAPGAIAAALSRLRSDPSIGAVGGKVIRTNGLLQEAGNIVWQDGTTTGYLRDASPLAPEANFVRDVDFCSAVFLMLRRNLLDTIGGFDEAFVPAYYEDADLCLRIAASGSRIVYEPSAVVHHHEYGNTRSALEPEAAIELHRQIFRHKHGDLLRARTMADSNAMVFARTTGPRRPCVLFIEDTVPLRRIGAGLVRSNDIVRVMAAQNYQVTVFPVNVSYFNVADVFSDMPDTVEVMHDRTVDDLPIFLADRQGYYDVIWIARAHNLDSVREIIERTADVSVRRPRIILDTGTIVSQRAAVRATLPGQKMLFDLGGALRQEFANACICDTVIGVSLQESDKLRELGFPNVATIGHMREVKPTPRPFAARAGMLFVGAIHDLDSPNYDALCWFVDDVLPLIERSLGWETRLTVAGYTAEKVSLDRFRDHPRVTLRGAVVDTLPLYDAHRLFVAPTRYSAGIPYKVHEAASFGLPIVATDLLRGQLGWNDGIDLLSTGSADAGRFADLVVMLYRDPALWHRLRDNALQRLRAENASELFAATIRAVLEAV
jgi:O-antigen biosynthesis protein